MACKAVIHTSICKSVRSLLILRPAHASIDRSPTIIVFALFTLHYHAVFTVFTLLVTIYTNARSTSSQSSLLHWKPAPSVSTENRVSYMWIEGKTSVRIFQMIGLTSVKPGFSLLTEGTRFQCEPASSTA